MSERYVLTELRFAGRRFEDHGLELGVLADLAAYERLVVETAKDLWRSAHPRRERLPKGYEDRIRLKLYKVAPGSATAIIERVRHEPESEGQMEMPEAFPADEVDQAAVVIEEAIEAASGNQALPTDLPARVLPLFGEFGRSLREEEFIEMRAAGRENPTRYAPETRDALVAWRASMYDATLELTGEVRLADLEGSRFLLRVDEGTKVEGRFAPDQECIIVNALAEHDSRRVRVRGLVRCAEETGKAQRFLRIDAIEFAPTGQPAYDERAGSVLDAIIALADASSEELQSQLPPDLATNLDKYLNE